MTIFKRSIFVAVTSKTWIYRARAARAPQDFLYRVYMVNPDPPQKVWRPAPRVRTSRWILLLAILPSQIRLPKAICRRGAGAPNRRADSDEEFDALSSSTMLKSYRGFRFLSVGEIAIFQKHSKSQRFSNKHFDFFESPIWGVDVL